MWTQVFLFIKRLINAPCVHINIHTIFIYTRYCWDYISCNVHIQIMRNNINQEEHLSVTILTNELSYCTCCIERCIPVCSNMTAKLSRNLFIDMTQPPHFRCRRRIVFMSAFYMYCLFKHPSWGLWVGLFSTIIEGTSPAVKGFEIRRN